MYQVLIVDDEPIVKIALQSMLNWEDLGFCICALASNGKEALDMAERFHPDLIICDLKMPVLDGLALIRTAKETGMDCEFLVISNYEDFNSVRTALVLGAFDYLLKVSISPEALTEQLKKIRLKLDAKHAVPAYTERQYLNRVSNEQKHAAWRDFFIHPTTLPTVPSRTPSFLLTLPKQNSPIPSPSVRFPLTTAGIRSLFPTRI